ncbi:MAG: R3H domain-containing nucleic acid-binding protein [Candidatus Margulisiibacteriota bacterium]
MAEIRISDALKSLLEVLPPRIKDKIYSSMDFSDMIEVILDLGKIPEIRFEKKVFYLEDEIVAQEDIDYVSSKLGKFTADNRAGIERTLHRISAIRNRTGKIIGLTCRVGRAAYGTIDIIKDIIRSNKSILFLGPPGIGKTTKLRESARVLSGEMGKRVIVVDTSNEIAGDGDIPHEGIGKARRMQVPSPDKQHAVMIEAVENHMPEVIIIDEIGTQAESEAARTIAERGVVLIGTAHGITLDNLISNPTLSDLIGGIQTVILGDEEAKRRKTQKAVLERKAPPTFDIVIEIRQRDEMAVYHDTAAAVDFLLRGKIPLPEVRIRKPDGEIEIKQIPTQEAMPEMSNEAIEAAIVQKQDDLVKIFPFGINNSALEKCISALGVDAEVVDSPDEANVVLAIRSKAVQGSKILKIAREHNLPVHVIKNKTHPQINRFLKGYFRIFDTDILENSASEEVEKAAVSVKSTGKPVDLAPQNSYIRRLQHQLIERYGLKAQSFGSEPNRKIRIFPK